MRTPKISSLTLGVLMGTAGCAGGNGMIPRAVAPEAPSEGTKCKVAASQDSPLVTEWPASEKANLEVSMHEGGVVVAYSGCEMRILPECNVSGTYVWQRTSAATDFIEIHDDDELWAKLPLGAASLEGELRSSGRLAMQTTVSGQLRLTGTKSLDVPKDGVCAGATHVIGAVSVGAFQLKSGGALGGKADASVGWIGNAHAGTSSSEALVRQAGIADSCRDSTDTAPTPDCRSPIQAFLWPLPSTLRDKPPPGSAKVTFTTADAETVWQVVTDDQVQCDTPCSKFLPTSTHVMLRERDPGFLQPAARISIDDLSDHATGDSIAVRAHPTAKAMQVSGIMATIFAGAATIVGTSLTAVGCGRSPGTCEAGLITLPIGLAGLYPSIWLLVHSGAHAEIEASAR